MKLKAVIMTLVCALTGFGAFADTPSPICLTLNQPGKWGGGLVLKIVENIDGTTSAYLASAPMFFGAPTAPTSEWHVLAAISPVTKSDAEAGAIRYAGGTGSRKLSATLGVPDKNGGMQVSIDIQLDDLNMNVKSALLTRFRGDGKCE